MGTLVRQTGELKLMMEAVYGRSNLFASRSGRSDEVLDNMNTQVLRVCQMLKREKPSDYVSKDVCDLLIGGLARKLESNHVQKNILTDQRMRRTPPNLKSSDHFGNFA